MRTPFNERLSSDTLEHGNRSGVGPDGARPVKSQPERRCILSREKGGRDRMVRLALSPAGVVLPDVQSRAPGRGAWIGCSRGKA